jgi:O-antigen ligase
MFLGSSASGAQSAGKRLERYEAAGEAIQQRPVLGLGLGGWSLFYRGEDVRDYPHNLLLEITVEQGIVGLLAFTLLVGAVLIELRTIRRHNEKHAFMIPVFAFTMLVSLFSGDLNDNRAVWLWCGFALALSSLSTSVPTIVCSPRQPWTPRMAVSAP